ncbi:MAG TPA: tRNA (adenosine(37)-N6)-threonylcarbamoyltransferase complex dimerization subunit type 1 TsaB [Chitinophagaceae bacterium]|nr:tRNA (adenosine(37)-N6)-threonylcarbamoyltransferase complex dimerization subunit type 1 TsaB [Chitinophagaceae bacterium]
MAYILNIHTATEKAIVSIAEDDRILKAFTNTDSGQHAAFLHVAIKDLLNELHFDITQLQAVGVSCGPGSYTGIRVGMATAKGLCYALNIPLVFFNSLELMALSAIKNIPDTGARYCPMIDARRMEVFAALYNYNGEELMPPVAMILDENSYREMLSVNKIYFFGSGSKKFEKIIANKNAAFVEEDIAADCMSAISFKRYTNNQFENIGYAQPLYVKEFHSNR